MIMIATKNRIAETGKFKTLTSEMKKKLIKISGGLMKFTGQQRNKSSNHRITSRMWIISTSLSSSQKAKLQTWLKSIMMLTSSPTHLSASQTSASRMTLCRPNWLSHLSWMILKKKAVACSRSASPKSLWQKRRRTEHMHTLYQSTNQLVKRDLTYYVYSCYSRHIKTSNQPTCTLIN